MKKSINKCKNLYLNIYKNKLRFYNRKNYKNYEYFIFIYIKFLIYIVKTLFGVNLKMLNTDLR